MSRHTINIDDPELQDVLDSADNKSEVIREALRAQVADESGSSSAEGLTDIQRKGLDVLLAESFQTGGRAAGKLSKDVAESQLAQQLQIGSESVVRVVIRPLISKGYLRLADRRESLTVYREPQPEMGEDRPAPSWESPGSGECVHTHLPDSTGQCLRCGEQVGTDGDETAVVTDGAGEMTDEMVGEITECTGEDCGRMLQGSTTVCVDCREG